MIKKHKQSGLTLVEMTVVISIAAIMLALTIPAANMLMNSFESEGGAKSIINAAMSSARAIAIREQRYAGIRFQKRYDPNDPVGASQYMIFIVHDYDKTRLENGFRAVEGIQPIKLPDSIGVMDMYVGDLLISTNAQINEASEVNDATAFSIIFSPSGKLVFHDVRVRNRDGKIDSSTTQSRDDVFNTSSKITDSVNPVGMFVQDDYSALGLAQEQSRNSFYIYDTKKLKQTDVNHRWTNYLSQLKRIYINPYTGTIVSEQ